MDGAWYFPQTLHLRRVLCSQPMSPTLQVPTPLENFLYEKKKKKKQSQNNISSHPQTDNSLKYESSFEEIDYWSVFSKAFKKYLAHSSSTESGPIEPELKSSWNRSLGDSKWPSWHKCSSASLCCFRICEKQVPLIKSCSNGVIAFWTSANVGDFFFYFLVVLTSYVNL